MSRKLTIAIEKDDVGVSVKLNGNMDSRGLIQGTAMIINQVCEIAKISPVELFAYATVMAEKKPDAVTGTCVAIEGGAGDE